MAPKRSSGRKLQVTKTKKVVKETVKVSVVDGDEKATGGETESVQNEQETEELVSSIPIEELAGHITVQIPVEEVQMPKAPETPADKTEEKTKKSTDGEDGDDEGSETEQEETEHEKTEQEKAEQGKTEKEKTEQGKTGEEEEEEEEEETEQPEKKDEGRLGEKESKEKKIQKGKTVPERGTKRKTEDAVKKPAKMRRKKRYAAANDTGGEGYKRYVFKVLKQVHPELAISSKAMSVINTFIGDMFERISDEAAKLSQYTNRMTLSSREIQDAVRLVLPGELGRHAVAEGAKALSNYLTYGEKKPKK